MLTSQEIRQYEEDGYVIPNFRLDDEALEAIRAAHTRLVAAHPRFSDYCPALLAFDTWFLNVARCPDILDRVEQLIGADFALWNSSFFAKPARVGTKTPWASGWRVLADTAARHLLRVDRGGRGDARERLPARHPRFAPPP